MLHLSLSRRLLASSGNRSLRHLCTNRGRSEVSGFVTRFLADFSVDFNSAGSHGHGVAGTVKDISENFLEIVVEANLGLQFDGFY